MAVSEQKELEHKGGQRQVHDRYIAHTAVDDATSNSEEIKPVALSSIVEICLAGGIS